MTLLVFKSPSIISKSFHYFFEKLQVWHCACLLSDITTKCEKKIHATRTHTKITKNQNL